jgi:Family of unknown function (DUF5947)
MFADADPAAFNTRIEALTRALDTSRDLDARRSAGELVRLILEFHGAGLQRLLRILADGPSSLQQRIASDPVVAGLLALHELDAPEHLNAGVHSRSEAASLIQIGRGKDAPAAPTLAPHGADLSRCERCGAPLGDSHRHYVDLVSRRLSCSCRACWLLSGVPDTRASLRAVPDRYAAGPSFRLTDSQWDALEVPVATAFFMFNSTIGRIIAFYPSPAGATESALALPAWRAVEQSNPWVRAAAPDVEAVLVRKHPDPADGFDAFIVPIDACYDLVGRIRLHWSGFDGGERLRDEIDRFFGDVAARSAATASLARHS